MVNAALFAIGRDLYVNVLAASSLVDSRFRILLYKSYGLTVGKHTIIMPRCFIGGCHITIGDRCFLNYGCFLDNLGPISIGDDCSIGMEAMLCTSTHKLGPSSRRAGAPIGKPIVLGSGCWIGARAIILPGVTVGSGSIIGAGAVVTKDCEPNGLYCGSPARLVRRLISDSEESEGANP
ncbi:MAG: DapH/DapD/GlmU-related protein [Terracidiphilus sp.]|jgi:maltose O-acetyltransferase